MKKYSLLFLAMMGVFSLTWTGCTDEVTYVPADSVEGQGIYFSKSDVTSFPVKQAKGNIEVTVYRTSTSDSYEATLNAVISNGDGKFTIPTVASFAAGESSTTVVIGYDNLEEDVKYEFSLSVVDTTVYGNSAVNLSVTYSNKVEYTWKAVSKQGIYIDNLLSMFGIKDFNFAKELNNKVVVEKAQEVNMYRFKSPYDNEYLTALFGGPVLPEDFELPYIILDGEKYEGKFFIPKTKLGFKISTEGSATFDPDFETIGSVFDNFSKNEEKYPLGSYDKDLKKFTLGALFHELVGTQAGVYPFEGNNLNLDPKLMIPDFVRDFTWRQVEGSDGQFVSELANSTVMVPLFKAEEDPTFYCLPQVYSNEGNLFFNIKDGAVTLPKKQKTGLSVYGNPVYMEGTPGKSSYDEKSKMITLGVTFYLADNEGNKLADLKSGLETFRIGHTEVDVLTPGKSIDDYVGTYNIDAYEYQKGKVGTKSVTLLKTGDNSLAAKGLSFDKIDDTIGLELDSETGLLKFSTQQLGDAQSGMPVVATLFNDKTEDCDLFIGTQDVMLGGFSSENGISFVNALTNVCRWNALMYFIIQDGHPYLLTGLYNYWDMTRSTETSAKSLAVNPVTMPYVQQAEAEEFKVVLNKKSHKMPLQNENKIVMQSLQTTVKL